MIDPNWVKDMLKFSTFQNTTKVMNPTLSQPLLDLQQVSYIENGKILLEDIQLKLNRGEIVSIIGPNGAGKTTLVKIALGLLHATGGKVHRKADLRIGYMPQKLHIDPNFPLTARRFLTLGQSTIGTPIFNEIIKVVGIELILDSQLRSLSGGEFQRVLLARALLREPELLVLDEPAQGVDLMGQCELYDLILRMREKLQCGILLVSHDLNVVMAQTDIVVCLNQHICCQGRPEDVSKDPAFTLLFGDVTRNLALYTHHHDHEHDIKGHIVKPSKDPSE
jgi:zinc transport system ATP-binding protein